MGGDGETDVKDLIRTILVYGTASVLLILALFKLFALIDAGKIAGEVAIPIISTIITGVLAFMFQSQGNREAVHLSNTTPGPVQVGPDNASVTVTSETATKPAKVAVAPEVKP